MSEFSEFGDKLSELNELASPGTQPAKAARFVKANTIFKNLTWTVEENGQYMFGQLPTSQVTGEVTKALSKVLGGNYQLMRGGNTGDITIIQIQRLTPEQVIQRLDKAKVNHGIEIPNLYFKAASMTVQQAQQAQAGAEQVAAAARTAHARTAQAHTAHPQNNALLPTNVSAPTLASATPSAPAVEIIEPVTLKAPTNGKATAWPSAGRSSWRKIRGDNERHTYRLSVPAAGEGTVLALELGRHDIPAKVITIDGHPYVEVSHDMGKKLLDLSLTAHGVEHIPEGWKPAIRSHANGGIVLRHTVPDQFAAAQLADKLREHGISVRWINKGKTPMLEVASGDMRLLEAALRPPPDVVSTDTARLQETQRSVAPLETPHVPETPRTRKPKLQAANKLEAAEQAVEKAAKGNSKWKWIAGGLAAGAAATLGLWALFKSRDEDVAADSTVKQSFLSADDIKLGAIAGAPPRSLDPGLHASHPHRQL